MNIIEWIAVFLPGGLMFAFMGFEIHPDPAWIALLLAGIVMMAVSLPFLIWLFLPVSLKKRVMDRFEKEDS